jgi:hypothetical protein
LLPAGTTLARQKQVLGDAELIFGDLCDFFSGCGTASLRTDGSVSGYTECGKQDKIERV